MVTLRRALATLLLVGAAACSAEDAPAAGPNPAAGPPDANGIAAKCRPGESLEAEERAAIESRARSVFGSLREGDRDALWEALHPQARREDQREAFMGALQSMHGRLQTTSGPAQLASVHHIDLSGGANAVAMVQCGAPDQPGAFTLMTNAGGEDVAVVNMRSKAPATELTTTLQLRRRGDRWRLLGINVSPSAYRGKDAVAYETMADVHMRAQRVVVAHFLLQLAKMLDERGASMTSPQHDRIVEKLAAIERDRLLAAETGVWTVGNARFRIEGLSLVATADGFTPVFEYVSPQGLVKDLLDQDGDALIEEVRRRFPELGQTFDAVVFEAYAETPNEPGRSYQAYRIVRYLDPAKRRG